MLDFVVTPFQMEDLEKVKQAGATSVVISTPFFSARGAAYFAVEQLEEVRTRCTQLKLRMYVQVNRFFSEDEVEKLRKHLQYLKEIHVDGIYYGDEGVLWEAMKLAMQDCLIYNPDTLITNKEDVQYYIDEGIQMVTLSKEITLEELCCIAQSVRGKVEVVIHGRLNMMHSKRALIRNYLDFIKQPKDIKDNHNLYIMEETRDERMPIVEDDLGTHVFTGYTLVSFDELNALVEAGVSSLRIDGIFKDIDYVCEALTLYQAVLQGSDASAIYEQYKDTYSEDNVTKGFYYTKTSKVK